MIDQMESEGYQMTENRIRIEDIEMEEKMKKNLQEQVEIPTDVEDKMQDAYRRIYQGVVTMKPAAKKRFPAWAKAAAAAVCVVFAGSVVLVSNPTLAKDLPLIGNIFDEMVKARDAEPYGYKDTTAYQNIKENAQQIQTEQMTAVDQGIKLEVTDAYCDGYDLYFTLGVQDEEGVLGTADGIQLGRAYETTEGKRPVTVTVGEDGETQVEETDIESLKNRMGPEVIKIDGTYVGANMNIRDIGDGTYVGVIHIDESSLPEKTFAEKFLVELDVDMVESANYGDTSKAPKAVAGEWNLSFEVTKDESKNQVFDVQAEDQGFAVEKIVQTPSNLHIDFVIPQEWVEQNPEIQVIDEDGNFVEKWGGKIGEREDGSQMREYTLEYSGSRNYTIRVVDKNNSSQDELLIITEIPITL